MSRRMAKPSKPCSGTSEVSTLVGMVATTPPENSKFPPEAEAPLSSPRLRASGGSLQADRLRDDDLAVAPATQTYLTVDEVAERLRTSVWTVYEMSRTNAIPHRKLPGRRGLLFPVDELQAFEDGAELETFNTAGGGRVCKPKS
jgi:excisionase family DNA binding protein